MTERGKEVKSPLSSQRHWEPNAIIPESLLPQTKRVIKELNTDISYGCDISLSLFPHFPFLFCSMFWFIVGCGEEKQAEKDDSEFPASPALIPARLQLFPRAGAHWSQGGEGCGFAHVTHSPSVPRTADWMWGVINPAKYQATRGEHCSKPFLWPIFLFDWEIIHTNLKLIKIWYFKNHS